MFFLKIYRIFIIRDNINDVLFRYLLQNGHKVILLAEQITIK